jgi:hypothetical protein
MKRYKYPRWEFYEVDKDEHHFLTSSGKTDLAHIIYERLNDIWPRKRYYGWNCALEIVKVWGK